MGKSQITNHIKVVLALLHSGWPSTVGAALVAARTSKRCLLGKANHAAPFRGAYTAEINPEEHESSTIRCIASIYPTRQ